MNSIKSARWVLAVGLALTTSSGAFADPTPKQILEAVYGKTVGDETYASKETDSYFTQATSALPQLSLDVKYSSTQVVLGVDSNTGKYQALGAIYGSDVISSTNPTVKYSDAAVYAVNPSNPKQLVKQTGSSPSLTINTANGFGTFAFDVREYHFAGGNTPAPAATYTAPNNETYSQYLSTHTFVNGSTQFDTAHNDNGTDGPGGTKGFAIYRLPDSVTGQPSYVLFLSLGNGLGDLVLQATGVKNPEPSSLALLGLGAVGLAGYRRLRRRDVVPVAATN
jgi:hypothetical protein